MRCVQKHPGTTLAAQPPAAVGGGSSSGEGEAGESCGAGGVRVGEEGSAAPASSRPGLFPPADGGGKEMSTPPPAELMGPSSTEPPRLARRSRAGHFGGLGLSGSSADERRVPSVLGGAAHRRDAGGPRPGGPERPVGRVQPKRKAAPLLHTSPWGRARDGLARPREGPAGGMGALRGQGDLRGPPGSSG